MTILITRNIFFKGLPVGVYLIQIEIPGSNIYPLVSNLAVSDIFWKYKRNDESYEFQVISNTNYKPLKNVSIKTYTLNFTDFKELPLQEYIKTYSTDNNGIIKVNRNKKGYRIFFLEFINGKDRILSNNCFYFVSDLMEDEYDLIPEEVCSDWLIENNNKELEDPVMSEFNQPLVYLILEKAKPVKWYKNPYKRLFRKWLKLKCIMRNFYQYKILKIIDNVRYQYGVWRKGY